jgi:hypothetical protein
MIIEIEGPYSFKDVDGLKTPVYIFAPGAVRMDIGEVTIHTNGSLSFEVELDEPYRDLVTTASFDVPMRFIIRNKKS